MSHIITVDTGGSKTQITLFDFKGNKINSTRCIGIGTLNNNSSQVDLLEKSINSLLCKKDYERVAIVIINVGGTNTEQIKLVFSHIFPDAHIEAYRESSGVIMSALCDAENADAILMAGTGSIAVAKGKNGNVILDGWCPNIGDFGSGYWIGLEAISRSVKALEQTVPLSPLAKYITGRDTPFLAFKSTTDQMLLRDEVRSRFMPLERYKVASIAREVAQFARNSDAMAIEILNDAGDELAQTVIRGLKLAGCSDDAQILISGGLTGCFDLWGKAFESRLNAENKNYAYRVGDADMTKGAIHYALQLQSN